MLLKRYSYSNQTKSPLVSSQLSKKYLLEEIHKRVIFIRGFVVAKVNCGEHHVGFAAGTTRPLYVCFAFKSLFSA